jgi:hypothetical protein
MQNPILVTWLSANTQGYGVGRRNRRQGRHGTHLCTRREVACAPDHGRQNRIGAIILSSSLVALVLYSGETREDNRTGCGEEEGRLSSDLCDCGFCGLSS